MHIRVFYLLLALMFIPVMAAGAGLDLSFSDTDPPAPLTDDVVPVGGSFSIDVMANAPAGTVAAVYFRVTWNPAGSVDYTDASAGDFLPGALVIGDDEDTSGSQSVSVTTTGGANAVGSGVLASLSFTKNTSEGSVSFGFESILALDLSLQPVEPVSGSSSSDISLPVVFSSLSAEVSEVGVIIRWRTTHEVDNAGFDVLRSTSVGGNYIRLNQRLIEGQGTSAVPHDYQYVDSDVTAGGTYNYKVEALDLAGERSASKTISLEVNADALNPPEENELGQNYPNPGNPDTWIPYILSSGGDVKIEIYSTSGQLVRTLYLGRKDPGRYISRDRAAYWDGRSSSGEKVPSDVYFYTLKAGSFTTVRKLVMLR